MGDPGKPMDAQDPAPHGKVVAPTFRVVEGSQTWGYARSWRPGGPWRRTRNPPPLGCRWSAQKIAIVHISEPADFALREGAFETGRTFFDPPGRVR